MKSLPPTGKAHRTIALGISLFVLLVSVYFVTYTGYAVSNDEWALFDATESMARRGNLQLTFQFDTVPPTSLEAAAPPSADTEPLQPALAAPLFLVAQALPGVGLVHTVWLFNILVTAASAVVVFAYGLELNYGQGISLLAALIYGLATIVWPYSQTFFREPLFTLLGISSAFLILRLRHRLARNRRPLLTAVACAGVLGSLIFAKEAAVLLLPSLVLQARPGQSTRPSPDRRITLTLIAIVVFLALAFLLALNLDTLLGLSTRYAFVTRARQVRDNLGEMITGITGYLISPARSLWLFSPILLAGWGGVALLHRERQWRQIAVPLAALVMFVVGYAAVRGEERWYGGLGWGPRYMVPLTPFLALWLLPVLRRLTTPSGPRREHFLLGSLLFLSLSVQLVAVSVPIHAYYDTLAAQNPPIVPWQEGAWSLRWSPIPVSITLLDDIQPNWAWRVAGGPGWLLPLLSVALGMFALASLVWWLRRAATKPRPALLSSIVLGTGVVVVLATGLLSIRRDPRYYGDFPPTLDLLAELKHAVTPGDVILLNNETYAEFFMNYFKEPDTLILTLPRSPGERYSPEQPPERESIYPDELVHLSLPVILGDLSQRHERAWLVMESSRFIPWSVRPAEHYMARHLFPIREIAPHDLARAVLFNLAPAPPPTAAIWPDTRVNATFGGDLVLTGFDLLQGRVVDPGGTLPVSLLWQAPSDMTRDYTVALLLMSPDGQLVAQRDSFPVNGFAPTSTWTPETTIRDNHGLPIPPTLAPNTYELWLVVYWWQEPDQRLTVTAQDGHVIGDHLTLASITVK